MKKEVDFFLATKPIILPLVLSVLSHFLMLPSSLCSSTGSLKLHFPNFSILQFRVISCALHSHLRVICCGLYVVPPQWRVSLLNFFLVTDFILYVSIFLTSLGHIASEIGRKGQSVNAQSDSRYITEIYGDFWQYIPHMDTQFSLGENRSDERGPQSGSTQGFLLVRKDFLFNC